MSAPWEPERPVSVELARAKIEAQHPELRGASIEPYASGWDNVAYRVGGQWIFRFPQRAAGVEPMRVEIALLPELAPELPIAIPAPRWIGAPTPDDPWPFAGYREIAGRPAYYIQPQERLRHAEALGRFVRALHSFDVENARAVGLPGQSEIRRDWDLRVQRVRDRLAQLGFDAPFDLDAVPRPRALAVVHGDLHARHVLMGDAIGVIDWGDVHEGDPAMDLAIALMLPPEGWPRFERAYGAIDDELRSRARFEALYMALALVPWARETGDSALEHEALRTLDHLRQDMR